ncbi:homoserine O-acetyltransferase MetX [Candidatus Spongiisocius sp.]|uniref:homoserine O-acetyltransferase MetX n=1 Tax=Candidatus Spongiisocius sp. TaxID=3101273 RepID=UPI003B5BFCA9
MGKGIGPVETRFFTFGSEKDPFVCADGGELPEVTLAYEIYGELNEAGDNAILLFHALTGSHHAAGENRDYTGAEDRWTEEVHTGWWDDFIGPGRSLNTDKFAVICANWLGHCYGTTGPASINPLTGKPYGPDFPLVSAGDTVRAHFRLLDHLGVKQLHAVVGGSVGGMMCLDVAVRYPGRVRFVVPIAAGLRATTLHVIHDFEQINAIYNDPDFNGGHYYDGPRPDAGLALARMIGHKTFVSLDQMKKRARGEVAESVDRVRLPIESYMWHQGQKFVKRFDANAYLRTMWAWQDFDLYADAEREEKTLREMLAAGDHKYLVFSIDSDVCYYPGEQKELAEELKAAGVDFNWITVHSEKGHDAFLLEPHLFEPHLRYHLESDWDPS